MISAIFRVMFLGLLRDRGALAMAFVLPPLIYMIFAAIFSGTTGGDLRPRVAIVDEVQTETSKRLVAAVAASADLRPPEHAPTSLAEVEAQLRRGEIDAGIVVYADPGRLEANAPAPIHVIVDSARAMAGPIVTGQLMRLFREYLPDASYRRTIAEIEQRFVEFAPDQRARVEAVLEEIRRQASEPIEADAEANNGDPLIEQATLSTPATADANVIYYAGAVGFLFLLFSAMQGAISLIDERQSGIIDRLLAGAGSVTTLITGKFLFLLLQGVAQVGLIFALAYFVYGVTAGDRWPDWLVITVASSACAAGLGLALAAICRTRQQAVTLSNFLVLVLSALGGSMVPRFFMPAWLQDVSWFIPNAWAVEAYSNLLWRNAPAADLVLLVGLLAATALSSLVLAGVFLRSSTGG